MGRKQSHKTAWKKNISCLLLFTLIFFQFLRFRKKHSGVRCFAVNQIPIGRVFMLTQQYTACLVLNVK